MATSNTPSAEGNSVRAKGDQRNETRDLTLPPTYLTYLQHNTRQPNIPLFINVFYVILCCLRKLINVFYVICVFFCGKYGNTEINLCLVGQIFYVKCVLPLATEIMD